MKSKSIIGRLLRFFCLLMSVVVIFSACNYEKIIDEMGENFDKNLNSAMGDKNTSAEISANTEAQDETVTGFDTAQPSTTSGGADFNTTSIPSNTTSNQTESDPDGSLPPIIHTSHYHPSPVSFDNDEEDMIYKNIPNKNKVHILMHRKYTKYEQNMITQYQKLTGVKLETTVTTESEYQTKLVSMISEGNSPDVAFFTSREFPSTITKCLQPLSKKTFRLNSNCWNKKYLDAFKINDVCFGVAMPSTWSCEDLSYVTYYSPELLKKCGVTTMPIDLYQQGNWNWESQREIVHKLKNKGFIGLALQSYDLFMLSSGVDFVKYDGKLYTNQLGNIKANDHLADAWKEVSQLQSDGCLTSFDHILVQQGKVGIFTAVSYGMVNDSNWFSGAMAKTIQAVPVAGPKNWTRYTPVSPKCWGVPKKAKNPDGAAFFLRYFLDTSNYDLSSTFYNKQFESVYKIINSSSTNKAIMYGFGVSDYVERGTYSKICNSLVSTTPANIISNLNAKKSSVHTGLMRANKDIARIK